MPDMPGRICGICSYKAKIFFLLTRQFVIGQQIMRAAVTDFYRDNYGIEPPEQLEDLLQMRKQLENVSKIKLKPTKQTKTNKITSVYGQVKSNVTKRRVKANPSSSNDKRFDVKAKDSTDSTNKVPKGRKNTISNQNSPTRINNIRQPNKAPNPVKNVNSKAGLVAQRAPYARKERTGVKASSSNQEVIECHVPPRLIKKCINFAELRPVKSVVHCDKTQTNQADGSPQKSNIPPSKAQMQKKLLERRKQWR